MAAIYAERLRKIRKDLKYTQLQVTQHTGINNKTLSGYEAGRNKPDYDTLKILCDFYGVSTDWVLGHTNNPLSELNEAERDMAEKVELNDDSFIKGDITFDGVELNEDQKRKIQAMARLLLSQDQAGN